MRQKSSMTLRENEWYIEYDSTDGVAQVAQYNIHQSGLMVLLHRLKYLTTLDDEEADHRFIYIHTYRLVERQFFKSMEDKFWKG